MNEIELINFQGHEHSVIKVAPVGITAIIGATDAGKSSIKRGIKLVQANEPSGDAYIRNTTNSCSVRIDDVTRIRNPKLNGYEIKGIDKPLSALRSGVPEIVDEKLNLSPDNIQDQHNSLFLLDLSPGKVAQKLSSLVDLDAAIESLKLIKKRRKDLNIKTTALLLNISETELKLNHLEDLEAAKKAFDVLRRKNDQISHLKQTNATLRQNILNAENSRKMVLKLPNVEALPEINILIQKYSQILQKQENNTRLHRTITIAEGNRRKLSLGPEITNLLNKIQTIHDRVSLNGQLHKMIATVISTTKSLKIAKHNLSLQVKLKKEVMGDTCRYCGSKLNNA